MTYAQVAEALSRGADPDMLCMTCPWDRNCVTPPTMTRAEVDAKMKEAKEKDLAQESAARSAGKPGGMPQHLLLTAMTFGARGTMAPICPVLAMRLRLPEGREIVEGIKQGMQARKPKAE